MAVRAGCSTWPFRRSSPGVAGERLARRVDGLDDRMSVLSRLRSSSSRGPRTVNDPYTPSPCCETNGPPRYYFSHWRLEEGSLVDNRARQRTSSERGSDFRSPIVPRRVFVNRDDRIRVHEHFGRASSHARSTNIREIGSFIRAAIPRGRY